MSTGNTHSFFSISRMRVSAEIGSANSTRSTRVRRANSTMSSTLPSFGLPAQVSMRAVVVAVVEHAEHFDIGIILDLERLDQLLAVLVRADHDGAAIEPALARPAANEGTQEHALGHQRRETDEEEGHEPQPRNIAAELDEEGCADEQQEHKGPGRDHPGHLAKLAAEYLDLVDVGGLEAEHGRCSHGEDRRDIFPVKAVEADDIGEIERDADRAQHHEIGDANRAGDHDRRVGAANFLVGDGKGRRRQPAAPFDRRAAGGGGDRGRCRGIEHRASVNRFHLSTSVLEQAHGRALPVRNSPHHGLTGQIGRNSYIGKERLTIGKRVAVAGQHALDHRLLREVQEDSLA